MRGNEQIGLGDTGVDVLMKISEGNPGALNVCMQVMAKGAKIDPQAFMGGFGVMLSLDTHNIRGSRVWMLYKDVCGEHLGKMLGVLRAVQLGFFSDHELDALIDGRYSGEETADTLTSKVVGHLDEFNPEPETN